MIQCQRFFYVSAWHGQESKNKGLEFESIIMPAYIEYGIGTGSYHKASSEIEKNIYIEYPGPGHRI